MIYSIIVRESVADSKTLESPISMVISLDVTSSYSEKYTSTVIKSPVENGFPVTDSMNPNNPAFSLQGIISSYNIYDTSKEAIWSNGTFSTASDEEDSLVNLLQLKTAIRDLINKKRVFSLVVSRKGRSADADTPDTLYSSLTSTLFEEHFNCACTDITFDMSNGMSDAYNVNISFERIRVATTEVYELSQDEQTKALRQNEVNAKKLQTGGSTASSSEDSKHTDSKLPDEDKNLPTSTDTRTQQEINEDQKRSNKYATDKIHLEAWKRVYQQQHNSGVPTPPPSNPYSQ